MKKQTLKKFLSGFLLASVLVSSLPFDAYATANTEDSADANGNDAAYAFAAESIVAPEDAGKDSEQQITITRSGDLSEPSEMVLLSYDINADYGEDYVLTYNGETVPKADSVTSMYAAFKDNRVVSDYEEDNKAFVDSLLSHAGLSLEGENELVPSDEKEGTGQELSGDQTDSAAKSLTDADSQGADFYDSLSTLGKIGANSSRTVISFAAGEGTKEITLTVKTDGLVEYDESFLLGIVSPKTDEYLMQHTEGIPDIPLKQGRDIAVTSVNIGDSSQEEPECTVSVEKTEYTIENGTDTVSVGFTRKGATDTYSTVLLSREGKSYGYFHFTPYQEIQEAKLEAGIYQILAYQNCTLSGSETITVTGPENAIEEKTAAGPGKASASSGGSDDLDTIYDYSPLPDNSQAESSQAGNKQAARAATNSSGNPDWFPDWANIKGTTETADYIAYVRQGKTMYGQSTSDDYHKGYSSAEYINDKKREHHGKSVYNTYRMNTSGFLSGASTNIVRAISGYEEVSPSWVVTRITEYYDMTGIESVETSYYVDDTDLNVRLGVSIDGGKEKKEYVNKKGVHSIKAAIPNDQKNRYIYFQNDNKNNHDGADVYLMNAFRLNKRTYQVAVNNSNKLEYVTKSGGMEQVAAESVGSDHYSYLKMDKSSKIVMNLRMYDNYPMALTGYQFINKEGNVIANSRVNSTSDQIAFNKDFIKNYEKYSFSAKREDQQEAYTTFQIQPIVSKIPVEKFDIENGSKDSVYNPYYGELVLENKSKDLYQGDYVTLSAKDIQEGYTFSGAYIRYRKTESSDWESVTQYADSSGKVIFRLGAGYSQYEVEPVFSGHEADTVTISYADGARDHGSLTSEDKKAPMITLVNPEEYQINSYVPLVANPNEGYVTCWYSGNRTYYGNTFYYQMDGNSKHNNIIVDFLKKGDIQSASVNLELSVYENEVNLRNSSFDASSIPLADMQFAATSGKSYQGTTDAEGKTVIENFEGVIGGTYSMILYKTGENRYRYVEFEFTGNKSCNIRVPAFSGMSAYPSKVTARIDGTSADQSYIDLTNTGEVEIMVDVYRPDPSTKLGAVGLSFYYEGEDGMTKQDYTIEHPDGEDEDALGVHDTYTLKVASTAIPDLSYLYVDVKSSYEIKQTGQTAGQTLTVDCDTGYVNTGYKFKTPSVSSELAILEDVPELPGLEAAGEDLSIPYIGSLDFGFTAKNGAYFVRQNDPNTNTWYLLAGYNVASTWSKTMTDRFEGAEKTAAALDAAEEQSRAVGDINGGGSNLVTVSGKPVVNIAPALSLKLMMQDSANGGTRLVGFDAILGLDELISLNEPFTVYGVPCYVNITFNGEEFFEIHAEGQNLDEGGVKDSIFHPQKDTEITQFIQAPNLDLTVKTGVGFNAFAGVYISLGGNLKFNLEHTDKWNAGGYFYLKGGLGADLAVFSVEETVNIPGSDSQEFGDATARSHIHKATTTVAASASGAGAAPLMENLTETIEDSDKNPVFTVSRNNGSSDTPTGGSGGLADILKPAGKNVKMKLVKLSGNKLMAMTLADNGAAEGSLNYLGAVYAISSDGGKTWSSKENISQSDKLQWNIEYYKLNDKLLLTWSEGDLDHAVGADLNADSDFRLPAVAKALTAFDLKGRYFDLDGNPLGDSFTIAEDENVAINSLDAVENTDGTVELYYERRAYNMDASALAELMSQEQAICKAVLDSEGKTAAEDTRFLIQSEDGKDNYRITELKSFSHNGIEGQIVVLDADGKLIKETENGMEASIDDRQIYLRVVSDKNGNIPDNTLVPVTESGTCAQHISLLENGGHIYLFWNQNGALVSTADFLPKTAEEYENWKEHAADFGIYTLVSDENSLTPDTEFQAAMNEDGKGILLWKDAGNNQDNDTKLINQIYAGTFITDENGQIASSRGPIPLSGLSNEINNLDVQVLDDGKIVYGYTQLDGASMLESSNSDAVVEDAEEAHEVQITKADSEDYPFAGEAYTSYVTLWNSGMADAENVVLSASGALNGTAPLAELMIEEDGNGNINAGQVLKVGLPVTAANSLKDGDEVTYTLSQGDTVLSTFKDTVHVGAYMVPEEMASVISIPGTDDYRISLTVMNKGNQEGTTDVSSYTYNQSGQTEEANDIKECSYKDGKILKPRESAEISFIMKDAAYTGDGMRMIGIQTGEGYGQAVEGMLPDRVEAFDNVSKQPDDPKQPDNPNQPEPPKQPALPKKGDIVTIGSNSAKASYKVTSSTAVTYNKTKVPSGTTSAKVPDTVKISGKAYKVTAIAAGAFQGNKKLKKITVGKYVTKIPSKAFSGCTKLTSIEFQGSLTSIGSKAFYSCKALTTAKLGSKVASIGSEAFSGCSKLKTLKFGSKATSIGSKAFYNCKTLKTLKFGNNLTSIGSRAFYNCTALKSADLGSKLASIGSKAFYGDKNLSTLKISSKKLNKIGASAFSKCKKLKTLTLKSTKLKKKSVKDSLKGSSVKTIKTTSSLRKKYKQYFTKKNAGRSVTVK